MKPRHQIECPLVGSYRNARANPVVAGPNREIEGPAGPRTDGFYAGYFRDLDGNKLVVGAQLDDDLGPNAGAAYVFHFDGSTWNEEAKLHASDGGSVDASDQFGTAVAMDSKSKK